jgi:hypothetical protein
MSTHSQDIHDAYSPTDDNPRKRVCREQDKFLHLDLVVHRDSGPPLHLAVSSVDNLIKALTTQTNETFHTMRLYSKCAKGTGNGQDVTKSRVVLNAFIQDHIGTATPVDVDLRKSTVRRVLNEDTEPIRRGTGLGAKYSFPHLRLKETHGHPSTWDVSFLTKEFKGMFRGRDLDELDLKTWDVSGATDMTEMFKGAHGTGEATGLSEWKFVSLVNTRGMFDKAKEFNADISKWDMSKVKDASRMFYRAEKFDQILEKWNMANCEYFSHMFYEACAFQGNGLDHWKFDNAVDVSSMFSMARKFNCDLSSWDLTNVECVDTMLLEAGNTAQKTLTMPCEKMRERAFACEELLDEMDNPYY